MIRTVPPEVNVADIQQTAHIRSDRQALFADVKGSAKPDGQRYHGQVGSPFAYVAIHLGTSRGGVLPNPTLGRTLCGAWWVTRTDQARHSSNTPSAGRPLARI